MAAQPMRGVVRGAVWLLGLLLLGCSAVTQTAPPAADPLQRPAWINEVPVGHFVGSSNYSYRSTKQARELAITAAVSQLVVSKAGNTASVQSELTNQMTSLISGNRERLSGSASIQTQVTLSGKSIPVQFRVLSFWKDRDAGEIYALIEDLQSP